jgi:hypothetical protein
MTLTGFAREMRTNRLGSKRKLGARNSSGRLIVERVSPQKIAAGMPHRRGLPPELQLNQRAECVLGRMSLHGEITKLQFLAGQAWASMVGSYVATIGAPHALAGTGKGYNCVPDCALWQCECARRRERYQRAFEAVMKTAQNRGMKALNHVAIHDRECPIHWLPHFRYALTALVHHLGLTSEKKIVKWRN